MEFAIVGLTNRQHSDQNAVKSRRRFAKTLDGILASVPKCGRQQVVNIKTFRILVIE